MAIFVVMEPPAADADVAADRAVFVRDGFAFWAFVAPVIWLLWHRLWIEAALALAAGVALAAIGETAGLGLLGAGLSLLVSLFVGLEGPALRINALRRRGWRDGPAVDAGSVAEAEIRYLADAEPVEEPTGPPPTRSPAQVPAPWMSGSRPAPSGPALGLLGYPGRR